MKEAYVSIGSNIDASKNIQAVKSYLSIFDEIRYSSIYTTPPHTGEHVKSLYHKRANSPVCGADDDLCIKRK